MSSLVLSAELLSRVAGWQAVKEARGLLAAGAVRESNWSPPRLTGVVQTGGNTYQSGLEIHSLANVENLCTCRQSRREGTICAHAVAVGLHALAPRPASGNSPVPTATGVAHGSAQVAPARPLDPGASGRAVKRLPRAAPGEPGTPLQLHVILPPNFVEAVARGKAMLAIEAACGARRVPLPAVDSGAPFQLEANDAALLDQVETLAGEPAGMLVLSPQDFDRVLGVLAGHPRVTLGRSRPLQVSRTPVRLAFVATLETNGEITLKTEGPPPATFLLGESLWAWTGAGLGPVSLPSSCRDALARPRRFSRAEIPTLLSRDWAALTASAAVAANFQMEDFRLDFRRPDFRLHLDGGLATLEARLEAAYGDRVCPLGRSRAGDAFWTPDESAPTRYWARDAAAEEAAQARLLRAGFSAPDPEGRSALRGEDAVLRFFAGELTRLQREWTVTLEARLQRSSQAKLERVEPTLRVTPSGEQWFEVQVSFNSAGGEPISAADIQRLILSRQSHTRLKNGRIALIDTEAIEEFHEVLRDCQPQQQAGAYRIAANQAGFMGASLRGQPTWQVQAPTAWTDRARTQAGEVALTCPPLGELESVLRPYQKEGVAWLQFLRRNGFGGILADEMGLGKTLQTLAHLDAVRTGRAGAAGPSLVVCPTSLVQNWAAEARRFTPGLRVVVLHGPDRQIGFSQLPGCDLAITSYALVRRDAEQYGTMEFDTVVLDEAQHIKNRATQNAQAVKSIRSRHRVVLTGTPLENSVLDLWSIFDFLMPGYLGGAKEFRERYEVPIVRDRDGAVQARLARRVRPFLLRRLKRDVAADLPEKLHQVAFCDLTEAQAAAYRQLLDAGRREVLEVARQPGTAKGRMVVLTTLLRLRQVCCDLRLLSLPGVDPQTASSKLELLAELLEEVMDGGHRALVFSQFTQMLALVRERLDAEGVPYCYLDGSTPDRAAVVERFQARSEIPVFLISLKAGGTGLNLTGADTVIHLDPWWNPAVEAQATDRAHRLGQTRVVTSYKLIARGTVEERILALQDRKRATLQAMLGDDEEFARALSWEEIQGLLTD